MKKTYEYLIALTDEIADTTDFRYAEEKWAVDLIKAGGIITYIKSLDKELMDYLYGELRSKRVELSEEQFEQIIRSRDEALKKAEARFGSFD